MRRSSTLFISSFRLDSEEREGVNENTAMRHGRRGKESDRSLHKQKKKEERQVPGGKGSGWSGRTCPVHTRSSTPTGARVVPGPNANTVTKQPVTQSVSCANGEGHGLPHRRRLHPKGREHSRRCHAVDHPSSHCCRGSAMTIRGLCWPRQRDRLIRTSAVSPATTSLTTT